MATKPDENPLWLCDHLQYVRMLSELSGILPGHVVQELRDSMNLTYDEVIEIFDRADNEWNEIKVMAPNSFNPEHHILYLESKWVLINHEAYKAVQRESDELKNDNRELRKILDDLRKALGIVD